MSFKRFFAVGPVCDLGGEYRVACRALGWDGDFEPPAAAGLILVRGSEALRLCPTDTVAKASAMAHVAAAESGTTIVLGQAVALIGDRVLYQGIERIEPASLDQVYAAANDAAEELLSFIHKAATIDPTNPRNRAVIVRRLADAMVAKARPWEVRAATAGRKFLDANWPSLTKTQRERLIQAATREIARVPVQAVKGINSAISVEQDRVMKGARKAAIQRHNFHIGANLTLADERAIDAMRKTNATWLTNEYGRRASGFERRAREIVEDGLQSGIGREDLAEKLNKELGQSISGRSKSYFDVFAGAAVDRARTRSELHSYRDAQITRWIASAVLDEVTTDYCRWVDGKVFEVEQSLSIMNRAEGADMTVDQMKAANPWARARTVGGVKSWYAGNTKLFDVKSSGMGTLGKGSYASVPGVGGKMDKAGIGPPPYHGRCRTTTVADTRIMPIRSPSAGPPAEGVKPKIPPISAGEQLLRDKKLMQTPSGSSIPLDGDAIEDFNVGARLAFDERGKPFYEMQFRLTEQSDAAALRGMKRMGGKSTNWEYQLRGVDPAKGGALAARRGTEVIHMDTLKATSGRATIELGREGALKGHVRIRVPGDDPKLAFAELDRVGKELGIKNLAVATPADIELAVKAKIVTQFDPALAARFRGLKMDPAKLDHAFEQVARKNPVARKILKDTVIRENFVGHRAGYSATQAKMFEDSGLPGLYHDSGAPPDALALMLAGENSGLLASATRYDRGVFVNGMSTIEDFRTGGADGVFTRVASKAKQLKSRGGRFRIVIRTEELGRQDWWAYRGDHYGRTSKEMMGTRWSAGAMQKGWKKIGLNNEVMFKRGIPVSSIEHVVARDMADREDVLSKLRSLGIKKINGKPIEKFVIVP